MSSKKRLQVPGITIESFDAESAEPGDELDSMDFEQLEATLIRMDQIVMSLPPGVTKRNGVTFDREAVHQEIQRQLRVHEEVRRTKQEYDDALVRLALACGQWGQA